jgi:arylsulfatase A-like enzyme
MWGIVGLSLLAGIAPASPQRPSVVLIVADDLGWGDVSFNGRKEWTTPNLDRLASRGVAARRFYAASCVCGPSRAALMTGKFPARCGVRNNGDDLPASETTIAEAIRNHGYRTGLFGKWHGGPTREGAPPPVHPLDQGFDAFYGFLDPYHASEKFPAHLWQGRERVAADGYADDLFTDRAIEFVKSQNDRPFLLVVSYTAPHFEIAAPEDEIARHRARFPDEDPNRPIRATYAAMITRLDANVGRLLAEVERQRPGDAALVIFTSDNGASFEPSNLGASAAVDSNAPLRGQKRTLWEGGIRVPTVIAWPGRLPAGVASAAPGQQIDLLPTILAATGIAPETAPGVDGVNQLPVWRGEAAAQPGRRLFWEWKGEGHDQLAVIEGDRKLIVTRAGAPELFDVERDPGERRDLAGQPGEQAEQLRESLEQWYAEVTRPRPRGSDAATPQTRTEGVVPGWIASRVLTVWGGPTRDRANRDSEPEPSAVPPALSALQGSWTGQTAKSPPTLIDLEVVGQAVTFHVTTPQGIRLTATGKLVVPGEGPTGALDWVGFRLASGLELPSIPSIYQVTGDTWTICSGGPNGTRPRAFARGDGPLADMVTFRRIPQTAGASRLPEPAHSRVR